MRDSIQGLYNKLTGERSNYEDRAELSARLTLPSLFPIEGSNGTSRFATNRVQSLGGKGVNHLAAKLVLALLPPAGQFFRFEPDADAADDLTEGDENAKMKITAMFSRQENNVREEIKSQDIRVPLFKIMRLLIVTGCVLVEKEKDGLLYYNLRDFVVERDGKGKVVRIILTEKVSVFDVVDKLSEEAKRSIADDTLTLDSYTMSEFDGKKWTVTQTVMEEEMFTKTYTESRFPFQVLDWSLPVGESYGRSYIDELEGDMVQYQMLTKAISEGAILAAKSLIFVNPLSSKGTRKRSVATANNGSVLTGSADDITSFTLDKNYDFKTPSEVRLDLKRDIEAAFLMERSIQRDAERVTAEEIRKLSQELETAFAGLYALISELLLKRIVVWVMHDMGIKLGAAKINIIVGIDALSRNAEAVKLDNILGRFANFGYMNRISQTEVMGRYTTFEGVDPTGLILDDEAFEKQQKKAAEAQMQQSAAQEGGALAAQAAATSAQQGAQ